MFLNNRIFVVLALVGIGVAPQFAAADSPSPRKDLMSIIRSYQSPVAKHEERTDGVSATPNHRLAKTYAEQNDVGKANTHFGLALQNATSKQVPAIAADYAAFLADSGDLQKSELILRQALTQVPQNEELTKMLARCLVLQDKTIEGLRYFKAIYSEAEAKAIIVEIYREQGNTDMLVAVERKWGAAGTARPEAVRTEPILMAAKPEPVRSEPAHVTIVPEPIRSEPGLVAVTPKRVTLPPKPNSPNSGTELSLPTEIVNTLPSTMRALSSKPAVATPKEVVSENDIAAIAVTPIVPPRSKSELFDSRIPIPVPNSTPQPMIAMRRMPNATSTDTVPRLPVPTPVSVPLTAETLVLENPVKLAMAPIPPILVQSEEREPPRPVVGLQPRKHYVINASTVTDLDALFPIEPVAATVSVHRSERPKLLRR